MAFYTIEQLEDRILCEYEDGIITEKKLDECQVWLGKMVEDILKDFLNQEMPENYSPVYLGDGAWEHTNGGYISACVTTEVAPHFFPYPWRYKAEIWLGKYEYEEKVFNRFIDAHQWLSKQRK